MILPDAMFIGFTGTPLLKSDKETSLETFGPYIGKPYRFDEAVEDGVVLDLRYEARDIDQRIRLPRKDRRLVRGQDQGPDPGGKGHPETTLGHLAAGFVSRDRLDRSPTTSSWTWTMKPRLAGRSRATPCWWPARSRRPASSSRFSEFRVSPCHKCAIVTSYTRAAPEMTGEEAGMGETDKQYVYRVYTDLLTDLGSEEDYEERRCALQARNPGG